MKKLEAAKKQQSSTLVGQTLSDKELKSVVGGKGQPTSGPGGVGTGGTG